MGDKVPDHTELDDELAALTDQILTGEAGEDSEMTRELGWVVRQLHQTIAPDHPPSAAFRARLTQDLTREWNARQQRRGRATAVWYRKPTVRLAALAATLVVVLGVVALLSASGTEDGPLQGTASGNFASGVVIGLAAGVGLGLLILWLYRRR
jgi:hypothetical protein